MTKSFVLQGGRLMTVSGHFGEGGFLRGPVLLDVWKAVVGQDLSAQS